MLPAFWQPHTALFAVALSKNTHLPDENPSSIAGSDWETLDFGDIEKELAARLSDDDLSDVLQYIDAVNTVKRLKLAKQGTATRSSIGYATQETAARSRTSGERKQRVEEA